MSFRGRLRLFFTIIVIVPMIAVALVLFWLTGESETGKADAGIAAGLRTAFALYRESVEQAKEPLRRAAGDRELGSAVAARRRPAAEARMRDLLQADPRTASIDFYGGRGEPPAHAGSRTTVAAAAAPVAFAGRRVGVLAVSVTDAQEYAREFARLAGLELSVFRDGRRLASTVPGVTGTPGLVRPDESHDFKIEGQEYRGRLDRIHPIGGPPLDIAVFEPADELGTRVADSRLLTGAILLGFLLLALASSVYVSRALQGQIDQFLAAARRLGKGDFTRPVPTHGKDEFAELGREFNSMSGQLEAKIDEVESKRRELEETIRRVGEAFASGLDRQGLVELAVETAVDACGAETGRALPVDVQAFHKTWTGTSSPELEAALEAAERQAFGVRPSLGPELLAWEDGARRPNQGSPVAVAVENAYALAMTMRGRLDSVSSAEYLGVISIARRGRAFGREESDLLEYLAAQAVVSIENAGLHETVQRQAVTDELTGLANARELHGSLDREIERSRRFESPLALVMIDVDDFKLVNDEHGHQQGDEVLVAVARVVRELSRDLDEPARYGGEELAVVLPQTDAEGAVQLAERMREAIERLRVTRLHGAGHLGVTASFGVASVRGATSEKSSLIAAADAALYRAKRRGKNRVEQAEPLEVPR